MPGASENRYSLLDEQDKPTLHADGLFRIHIDYHQNGSMKSIAYFGVNNNPILSKQGYARKETTYDKRGNGIEDKYCDVYNKAVINHKGFLASQ
jgi:hypothetical protein